ncbi:MAG: bifunctional DNA primase/polymerase [Pirellulales bacterium]
MIRSALDYAELGYPVLPIKTGAKAPPLLRHGLLDASTDQAKVEQWWQREPDANVAIRTDGLLVVDADVLPDGTANPWPNDPDKFAELASAAISATPRGGRHYVFRQPVGKSYGPTIGQLAPHVDTRADGSYIVVAPSVVDGKPYAWVPGSELDCRPEQLAEPPAWLLDALDKPRGNLESSRSETPGEANAIPSGQRNGTLTRLAGVLRRQGMSQGEIEAALLVTNRTRCNPPLPDDEVKTIAWSVARYEPDALTVAIVEDHAGQDGLLAPAVSGPTDPGPFPADLLIVPGLLGEFIRFTVATAYKPQPVLALGASLPLLGSLAGRKVADPYGTRTNIYTIGVADSGAGKERAREVCKELLFGAGAAKELLGPERIASSAGLVSAVSRKPSILLLVDEIGRVLKTTGDRRTPHLFEIPTILMEFFTASRSVYTGACYADERKTVEIDQPNVSLYGTTVPQSLFEAFTKENLTDGLVSRMMIFESADSDPDPQSPIAQDVPAELIDAAKGWLRFDAGSGNLRNEHPRPATVPYDAGAEHVIAQLQELERLEKKTLGAPYGTLWTRAVEKARKLALLYACSANPQRPVVTVDAATWACRLSEYLTRRLIYLASRWVSDNQVESDTKRVLRIIAEHAEGIDGTALTRATQWLRRREREEAVATLIESGELIVIEVPRAGRPKRIYVAA